MIDDKWGEGGLEMAKKVWHNIWMIPNESECDQEQTLWWSSYMLQGSDRLVCGMLMVPAEQYNQGLLLAMPVV